MALAARLNLRMQKEVKLLLSDPPTGASFPSLSSDHSSFSSIHAQLEGPEGSVYAKGIFDLKIGIPERYPFQPPVVTFLTPIYHPNIDNGGRICLDILNLPPKGAWQPSLNISTVLTSIGLLLSEPNPDDGLMCEASRECKYNRQAFDQKARAMTEKYAKAGARGHNSGTECMEINLHLRTELEAEVSDEVPKDDVVDAVSCQEKKKQRKIRKKLSLDSSGSTSKRDNEGETKDHSQLNPKNPMESEGQGKELINMAANYSHMHRRLHGKGGKLSLESSIQSNQKDSHETGEGPTAEPSNSPSNPQSSSMAPWDLSLELPGDCCEEVHQHAHKLVCGYKTAILGKHGQSSQMKSLGSADECHVIENDGQKPVSNIKFSSSLTPSNLSYAPNPNALPVSHDKSESGDDCGGKAGNNDMNTMLHKSSFSRKKLSLGLKVQPMQQEKVDKENLRPISVPLTHKQTGIIRQPLLQPQDPYTDTSERQLHDQHQNGQIGENQQGQEELLAAESVIVLDSEDSEEESEGLIMSKSLLTRKRAVKRSAYS